MKASKLIILATLAVSVLNVSAKDFSSKELQRRMLERRAVDAVIWGMPIVSLDAMRQVYFRDGKAKYGDIIWWPKGNAWMNQSLTPNTSLFSIVQRKVLTPNDFSSLQEFQQRLLAFQSHYERSASPFNWTFTRRDLNTLLAKIAVKRRAPAA